MPSYYTPEDRRAALEALARTGGDKTAAAKELSWSRSRVCRLIRELEREGEAVSFETGGLGASPARDGGNPYVVKGVSTLYDKDGVQRAQWVKTKLEDAGRDEAFKGWVASMVEDAKGLAPLTAAPEHTDDELLALYPMGDPHFGLLSWAKETGDNFDLEIAESLTFGAVDRLVASAPPAKTAMLLNLGDYFHADNSTNRTPTSGANLDVDGRFARIAQVGFRAMVRCIRRCLEKHERVIVRNNRGNHDPHQAYMLSLAVSAYFENEPRVEVDPSPASFYYYRFGKVLIGSTHGDGAKLADLPLIMANDAPQDWAAATFRHWHCGHFHHDQMKEHPGATVETHRTLAGRDSWHTHQGYRAGRDMKAIIYHRDFGEVTRIRCGINMLDVAA